MVKLAAPVAPAAPLAPGPLATLTTTPAVPLAVPPAVPATPVAPAPAAPRPTGQPARQSRHWLLLMWLCAWAIYAAYFQAQWVFGERPIYHITGDEPHYLVIATSLLGDGHLDVLNSYRDKDYFTFYPYHLGDARNPEDMHALYGRGGGLYSKHSLGLPLLLLPAMRLGGHGLAILFMMAVAGALSVQTYLLVLDAGARRSLAFGAWVATSFAAPLLLYADQFYPEVPGALLTVIGARAMMAATRAGAGGGAMRQAALRGGLALGLLPWLHLRYIPLAATLGVALLAAFASGRRRRHLPWLVTPAAIAGLALLVLDWRLFSGVPPVDEYGALTPFQILAGLSGLLLDRQFGLLLYSPIFLLALYGLPLLPRRLPGLSGWTLLVTLGVYTTFVASFSYWYGAFSPPSRLLVPVVPLLAIPLAFTLERWPAWPGRAAAATLLLLSWSVAVLLVRVPHLRYNQPDGHSALLEYLSQAWGRDVTTILPSFVFPTVTSYLQAALAILLAGGLFFLLAAWSANDGPR